MKKLFLSLSFFSILIFAAFFLSINFINFDTAYHNLLKEARVDKETIDNSEYKINKFPVPSITIDRVKLGGNVLEGIKVKFSLLSVLRLSPKISSIEINTLKLKIYHDDANLINHDEFINQLFGDKNLHLKLKVNNLVFIDNEGYSFFSIRDFDFAGTGENNTFFGNINENGVIAGKIFKNSKKQNILDINIEDDGYKLRINEIYENNLLKSGTGNLEITDISTHILQFIPYIDKVHKKLSSHEKIQVNFDIFSKEEWFEFGNIKIESDSIDGSGVIKISKNSKNFSEFLLDIKKIDITNWGSSDQETDSLSELSRKFWSGIKFVEMPIKTNIKIKDFNISADDYVKDFNIVAESRGSTLHIKKFSGKINKNGQFKLLGTVNQNNFRSIFNGKIKVNHNDLNDFVKLFSHSDTSSKKAIPFALVSDVYYSSVDVSLNNFILKTNDNEVQGSISSKFIGDTPRINASLDFELLNLDNGTLPVVQDIFNYIKSLTQDVKSDDYLKKFIPIRKINHIGNYFLKTKKVIFNEKEYSDVNFDLNIEQGQVKLNQFYFKDGEIWANLDLELIAKAINPTLKVKINDANLKTNILNAQGILDLEKTIEKNYDLTKIDFELDFSISKLIQNGLEIKQVLFKAKNNSSNILNIENIEASLLEGKLKSYGTINFFDPYNLNFSYAFNFVNLNEIAKLLPDSLVTTGGFMSINGIWSTSGNDINKLLYRFYTKSEIAATNLTFYNFSIDSLIDKINDESYDYRDFQEDLSLSLLTGETKVNKLSAKNVTMSKGVVTMPELSFDTKLSMVKGKFELDIYKMIMDAEANFDFKLAKPRRGRSYINYKGSSIIVKVTDSVFFPKKQADTTIVEQHLKENSDK